MSWVQRGADIDGESDGERSGLSVSLSSNGNIVAIGAPFNSEVDIWRGQVRVHEWNGNAWVQRGNDINGEASADQCGYSVSLSSDGSVVAIGAINNTGGGLTRGCVRVYKWNGTAWVQRGNDINGEADLDRSGYSVSLSSDGSVVAIGAINNDGGGTRRGHVRVHEWNGNAWVQRGNDIDGEADLDYSGWSVSLSSYGSVVAIGSLYNDGGGSDKGSVRVHEWNGNAWGQRGDDINGEADLDQSGYSVSLSSDGSVVAIGAVNNDGGGGRRGHVRVHKWNGTAWGQRGDDIDGEADNDQSGYSVSLSSDGSVVAIGAPYNNGDGTRRGHVRVHEWNGNAWGQRGDDIDGEADLDHSGWSVSLSSDGSVVAIGSLYNDGGGSDKGSVRVYTFPQPQVSPVCFLADAPVLTPSGYRSISTIAVGDLVRTSAGRDVAVKRVFAKEYTPSASANPYVIPKGLFGALRALPISPNHEVMVSGKGMIKAKNLGLQRMKMTAPFTYYNLELEDWVRDNLVVAGVECESLAPAKRITMTMTEFLHFVQARYGTSSAARLRSVCFEESDGRISMPALH